ncbi:hypothetical protein PHET_02687 [Paragonimus heterotremus]|uniref:MARVEL domain-containing protein n=1 Tax=Paragonimus heterotremus TaxID=100268 RepID=A0A8J4WIA7_9TREM|nr:hypothetical protein PHET_02687 [Paragonimus heterotremus]
MLVGSTNGPKGLQNANQERVDDFGGQINPRRPKWIYYENYFKTFPAIIRIAEVVLMFVAFSISCIDKKLLVSGGSWLVLTTVISLLTSVVFIIFHLFFLHRFLVVPWVLIEFVTGVFICILIFSSGVLSAAYSHIGFIVIAQTIIGNRLVAAQVPCRLILAVHGCSVSSAGNLHDRWVDYFQDFNGGTLLRVEFVTRYTYP